MRKNAAHAIVCAGLAGIIALGTCGCSTSKETTVTTEVTDEDGKTHTTKTTTTEKDGEVESTTTESTTIDVSDWEDAWYGEATKGHEVYYAESPDGGKKGMLVIYNPETETLESWVGDNTGDADGTYVTTTDAVNGSSFTFGINSLDEDGDLQLDMGDEYGTADLSLVEMDELLDMIAEVDVNGQVIV